RWLPRHLLPPRVETKRRLVSTGGVIRPAATPTIAQSLDPRSRPGTCAPFLHPWRWKRLFPPLVEVKCQISSTGGELDTAATANHRPEPCSRTETRPAGTTSPPMAVETTIASTSGGEVPNQLHRRRTRHCSHRHPSPRALFQGRDQKSGRPDVSTPVTRNSRIHSSA